MKQIILIFALLSILVLGGCKDKYEVCETGFESREALIEKDTAPDNPNIKSKWDCEEGCLYAEWITYGYKNLSEPSELYNECSMVCGFGDSYFTE